MIEKIFKFWNELKIKIHLKNKALHFREHDIWWTYIGQNIGHENSGKFPKYTRPVLILTKFNNESFLGIPLTSQNKKGKYYYSFSFQDGMSVAILSQIRLFDAKRLKHKMGYINKRDFLQIQKKTAEFIYPAAFLNCPQ